MDKPRPAAAPPAGRTAYGTILIVGGSSDVALETMRAFADGEASFIAHYGTSLKKLEALKSERPGLGVAPVQARLEDRASVEAMLEAVARRCGAPDKIVLCAAPKARSLYFRDAAWDDFELELGVQLRSAVLVLRRFLPEMAKRKKGKVVFVLSSYVLGAPPVALAHYVTAKCALLGLMRSLAVEYSRHGIGVNAVSPSTMATSFLEELPERMVEILAAQSPGGRLAEPRQVVPAIRFLLSPDSDFISGANIPVTGGSAF